MHTLKSLRGMLPNLKGLVLELHEYYETEEEMAYAERNLIDVRAEFWDIQFLFSYDDDVVNRILT